MAKAIKREFKILTEDGSVIDPKNYKYKKGEENLKILVEKEALGKENPGGGEPEYIKYCKRFGIDWEPMSDLGHMRYGPPGNFLFQMTVEYSKQILKNLGIPIYSISGTNLFNLALKPIAEHAKLFGDRLYEMKVNKKNFVLRYAACFQQFSMLKGWTISYRNLPFGVLEIADSYRHEQSGELLLCFRSRKMVMPDCHVICRDIEEGKEWSFKLHEKIYEEIKKLNRDYVSLYNLTSKEFFEKNKDWFIKMVKHEKKPVLLCFYPPGADYYWALNIEYHIIDKMKRSREIATVQIDIGNAKRFGIKYTDKDNKLKHPVILHTAVLGTIQRYLYTLFDTALKEKNPLLPMWISPIQVRLCPVNDTFIKYCEEIANELEKNNIRVDIDNRIESIEKKVRGAETDWVPRIVVIGEREKTSKKLAVRYREDGNVKNIEIKELIKEIKEKIKNYPYMPLPVPRLITKKPSFF